MIRYYLSPIVGTEADIKGRRPLLHDLRQVNWAAVDDLTGAGVMLVAVNAAEPDHAALRADSRLWAFPRLFAPAAKPGGPAGKKRDLDHVLDKPVEPDLMPPLTVRMKQIGVDLDLMDPPPKTARDVVRAAGQRLDPGFKPEGLWVAYL